MSNRGCRSLRTPATASYQPAAPRVCSMEIIMGPASSAVGGIDGTQPRLSKPWLGDRAQTPLSAAPAVANIWIVHFFTKRGGGGVLTPPPPSRVACLDWVITT